VDASAYLSAVTGVHVDNRQCRLISLLDLLTPKREADARTPIPQNNRRLIFKGYRDGNIF